MDLAVVADLDRHLAELVGRLQDAAEKIALRQQVTHANPGTLPFHVQVPADIVVRDVGVQIIPLVPTVAKDGDDELLAVLDDRPQGALREVVDGDPVPTALGFSAIAVVEVLPVAVLLARSPTPPTRPQNPAEPGLASDTTGDR